MAILPIITYDDEILRTKTEPVEENSEDLQELIDDMLETMHNADGVGLAAPQVGRPLRLFVSNPDPILEKEEDSKTYGSLVFINPEIRSRMGEEVKREEGCLSIPKVRENVTRPDEIYVSYKDREFNDQSLRASGWLSRIIQHEVDHLDGILFIDYLSSFRKRMIRSQLKAIENEEVETEYPLAEKKSARL